MVSFNMNGVRRKMKKKTIVLWSLIITLLIVFVGCNNTPNQGENDINIWTYTTAERILQDKDYSDFVKGSTLSISAVQNENESGQIILSPEKDVSSYIIETSDLVNSSGIRLSKENFTVYNQKYVHVTQQSQGYSSGFGWYPDALLPMEKAIEYGENKITAGQNQGITINFYIPKEQEPGVYNGNFRIIADGQEYQMPVSLTVYNYELTDSVTAKSCFLISRGYLAYSGDTTLENYKLYADYLIDHRIMPMMLPALDQDVEAYSKMAYEYAKMDNVSSINIPAKTTYSRVYNDTDIDWDALYDMTKSFALLSIETGVNIIEKCYFYFGFIDEASTRGGEVEDQAARVCNDAYIFVNDLADEIEASNFEGDIKQEVCDSLRNVPCVLTSHFTDRLYNEGNGVRNFCPQFSYFETIEQRELYQSLGSEIWWYGCIGPDNPFPTYQIDDNLISSRIVSWMQKDYNIAGNLYWETVYWGYNSNGTIDKIDVYNGNPMHFPGDNGDGYLMYPGDVYGIDGPVGTIRLESIRDGMEEYEILVDIENRYSSIGLNSNDILQSFYTQLYSNARVNSTATEFMSIRENMYQIASMCQNFDTYISDISQTGDTITYVIYAKEDVQLSSDGEVLSGDISDLDGYRKYTIALSFNKESNVFTLTAEKDGKSLTFAVNHGGKRTVLTSFDCEDELLKFNSDNATLNVVDGELYECGMTGNVLEVVFETVTDQIQSFKFESDLLDMMKTSESLSFDVFNTGDSVSMTIFVSVSGSQVLIPIGSATLVRGYQTVRIANLSSLSWDNYGEINYVLFQFGTRQDYSRTLYIDNIILQGKES